MDILTAAERSERMSRIRSKDTKPEMLVRRILHGMGYRFRLHRRDLPGVPDLVFPSRKMVVFVHGCFWHAHQDCIVANRPRSRRPYWDEKFRRNKERDGANEKTLKRAGWKIFIVWECETKDRDRLVGRLTKFLGPTKPVVPKKRRNG